MPYPLHPCSSHRVWECRGYGWLLSAAQVQTLRSLAAPCPDCGGAVASYRPIHPILRNS